MSKLEFPKAADGHFYLPIILPFHDNVIFIPRCFVDCGATKCVIPRLANDNTFHFPKTGVDHNVGTGKGERDFDCITIPQITIMNLEMIEGTLKFIETKMQEKDVEGWLGDDDDDFILGMSFLNKFDITMTKKGTIVINR